MQKCQRVSYACPSTGVVLSREELCQLQCPGTPYSLRGALCRCGMGLLAAYNMTDLPMAIAGLPYISIQCIVQLSL
jgi:hypothetical protein